jgi:hypothetical protein
VQSRTLGRTGFDVSVIGMGCWQSGGDWGDMTEGQAMATLHAAAGAGVTFLTPPMCTVTVAVSIWLAGCARRVVFPLSRGTVIPERAVSEAIPPRSTRTAAGKCQ